MLRGAEVLVIGGGITGAGVALDAASRGYRVGLVEQADYASGTSSRSTKLVHGGIRYLPQGHIGLVREGLRERTRLLRLAPHLVHPLPFVIPLYAGARRPLGVGMPAALRPFAPLGIRAGLFAYDLFAGRPDLRHRALSREDLERRVPDLRTDGLRAAWLYYDARTDDVRLTQAVLATARAHGALTVNYAAVTGLLRSGDRVTGARITDRLTGRSHDITARFVVNATGIWGEHVAALERRPAFRIRHSKGSHLVLRDGAVACAAAVVIPETDDGRLAFIVPWAGRPLVGTTDDDYAGDLANPPVTPAEVAYLLDHANRYLRRRLEPGDVTAAFAGIRPLVASEAAGSTAGLARDHVVAVSPGGLISILGGKLTSYRKMAEDAVDAIVTRDGSGRPCRTEGLPLAGAEGLDAARADLAAAHLAPDQQVHLLESYGAAARGILALVREEGALAARLVPGMPHLAAEVVYACRAEQAVALADVMFLRTRLAAIDLAAADRAVETVAGLMARELDWDAAERARQREAYEADRDRSSAWRTATFAAPGARGSGPGSS
ncbi:MAG: glycerol-3-phosphate dehydrogenase/oxidase [Armatimonadota bacterium]|nr:glycerol-3-phosphate dehydrogenase/oxidase [Armatimonadota bacterium]MDR7520017.1 glycerol-3-phosphate dehydrogenase/oxidase [Armatimonadota bacterium]